MSECTEYKPRTLKDVQGYLEELTEIPGVLDLFTWTQSKNLVTAKLKEYLGDKDKFGRLAGAFRKMGGEYVKPGSWKVTLVVAPAGKRRALSEITRDLRSILAELEAWEK